MINLISFINILLLIVIRVVMWSGISISLIRVYCFFGKDNKGILVERNKKCCIDFKVKLF
jgi:hypothetical protein